MSSEKARAINQMEIKYKTAEKDKQIVQNELLIAQQKSKIVSKNTWIAAIAGSIFLLVLVLAARASRARQKERLQAEQIKSLKQENTISILKGVVQGEEKERGRIARELHDGIGGTLSAAMMRMMSIRHEKEEIASVPAYIEAMDLLQEMGDEIRKTAHNLMPEVLLKQSLPDAIRTYCNFVEKSKTLHVDFQSYGAFDQITQKNKLHIYRIVQEMLKNITEHANATHALLQLQVNEQLLTITVEDNGSGFNTGDINKGIGLHNLQTRVDSMSGQFTIESAPGKGTSVYIEFDMHKMIADDAL
jgi:signal transduction histidine kinase